MRNYVIINGVNSTTIQGLAINILPPITKPLIRTQIEEIDGRDGDLVTELGYSAYDKQMEIGLWGTYDIDAIIKYFTGEGTIVFSTEPDKYYYFKILNQIDYEKLLKFKKATITFHCQPYKYPTSETPLEEQYEYVEATGTDLTLNNTEETIFNKFDLKGNTYQDSTTGRNITNFEYETGNGITFSGNEIEVVNPTNYKYINDKWNLRNNTNYSGKTYTIWTLSNGTNSGNTTVSMNLGKTGNGYAYQVSFGANSTKTNEIKVGQVTLEENEVFTNINVYTSSSVTANFTIKIMIVEGSYTAQTIPPYEPYTNGASPNSDYPQDIHVVSGDNSIEVCGKNLLDKNSVTTGKWLNTSGELETASNYVVSDYIEVVPGGKYYLPDRGTTRTKYYLENKSVYSNTWDVSSLAQTITIPTGVKYIRMSILVNGTGAIDLNTFQFEKGSTATTYEQYQGASYPISLGTMELCKIGDYQDRIYKDSGKWYLKKEIGKVVLNGSESWSTQTNYYQLALAKRGLANYALTNYFAYGDTNGFTTTAGYLRIWDKTTFPTSSDLKTWLSTHNTTVYYVLETPTYTKIEGTLESQLNALSVAKSYNSQTNITQTNNDMPFILDVSALKDGSDHLIIDNIGTAYSKPTIDIEGTGIVDIYLNDEQIFEIDLTTQNEIIIDTEKMEAYTPDNTLANRLVTGDYSNFKLAPGENDLRFSGDLTKATVTRYIRWI